MLALLFELLFVLLVFSLVFFFLHDNGLGAFAFFFLNTCLSELSSFSNWFLSFLITSNSLSLLLTTLPSFATSFLAVGSVPGAWFNTGSFGFSKLIALWDMIISGTPVSSRTVAFSVGLCSKVYRFFLNILNLYYNHWNFGSISWVKMFVWSFGVY